MSNRVDYLKKKEYQVRRKRSTKPAFNPNEPFFTFHLVDTATNKSTGKITIRKSTVKALNELATLQRHELQFMQKVPKSVTSGDAVVAKDSPQHKNH